MKTIIKRFFIGVLCLSCIGLNSNVLAQETEAYRWVNEPVSGRVYYLKNNKKALYWHNIDGKNYYFGKDGAMVIGWQYIPMPLEQVTQNVFDGDLITQYSPSSLWYYFDENGVAFSEKGLFSLSKRIETNTNVKKGDSYVDTDEKRNYYFNGKGYVLIDWIKIDDSWYFMKHFINAKFPGSKETTFYHNEGGEMFYGWLHRDYHWYYLDEITGKMITGWLKYKNNWYFLTQSGAMAKYWLKDGNEWYFLNDDGDMHKGWKFFNFNWYYLSNNGVMKTGWYKVGDKWYYSYKTGELAMDTQIDGYYVNHNGEWVE